MTLAVLIWMLCALLILGILWGITTVITGGWEDDDADY